MRVFRWLIAFLAAAACGCALLPSDDTATAQSGAGVVPPATAGKPHVCLDQYPAEEAAQRVEGTTTLGFRITEKGTVADITVIQSSGNQPLDDAAVRCAAGWRYTPALRNGEPVAISWKAEVRWVADTYVPPESAPVPLGPAQTCPYPGSGEGLTTVQFHVTAQGTVARARVAKSSGSEALDQAALACVGTWKYTPAKRAGQPVEIAWATDIEWGEHGKIFTPAVPIGTTHDCSSYFPSRIGPMAAGRTGLSFRITKEGIPLDVKVTDPSGNDVLDLSAQLCVLNWRYQPATVNGVPVEVEWQASVTWGWHGPW